MGDNVAAIEPVCGRVFFLELKKNAALADTAAAHLRQLGALVRVPSLADLDATQLRKVSEAVAGDLISVARDTGLQKPDLGN
ncbi:MAG TPA: hypothetical protein VGL55_02955 [Steroidobacteraceae bacterium]